MTVYIVLTETLRKKLKMQKRLQEIFSLLSDITQKSIKSSWKMREWLFSQHLPIKQLACCCKSKKGWSGCYNKPTTLPNSRLFEPHHWILLKDRRGHPNISMASKKTIFTKKGRSISVRDYADYNIYFKPNRVFFSPNLNQAMIWPETDGASF